MVRRKHAVICSAKLCQKLGEGAPLGSMSPSRLLPFPPRAFNFKL